MNASNLPTLSFKNLSKISVTEPCAHATFGLLGDDTWQTDLKAFRLRHPHPKAIASLLNTVLENTTPSMGFCITVPKNTCLDEPIIINYPALPEGQVGLWQHTLILEENAQANIVEIFDQNTHYHVATNIVLKEHAKLKYYQKYNTSHIHYHTLNVEQHSHSRFDGNLFAINGHIEANIHVQLVEPHAHCFLNGVVLSKNNIQSSITVEHKAPSCTSDVYYKHVLTEQAQGLFKANAYVHLKAFHTDASQTHRTLLLSKDAHMITQPQLEIFADDIKCKHGATIGQLDEDMLFYLKTRGIDALTSQQLLIQAFCSDVAARFSDPHMNASLQDHLLALLALK